MYFEGFLSTPRMISHFVSTIGVTIGNCMVNLRSIINFFNTFVGMMIHTFSSFGFIGMI